MVVGGECPMQRALSIIDLSSHCPILTHVRVHTHTHTLTYHTLLSAAHPASRARARAENDMMDDGPLLSATKAHRPATNASLQRNLLVLLPENAWWHPVSKTH